MPQQALREYSCRSKTRPIVPSVPQRLLGLLLMALGDAPFKFSGHAAALHEVLCEVGVAAVPCHLASSRTTVSE